MTDTIALLIGFAVVLLWLVIEPEDGPVARPATAEGHSAKLWRVKKADCDIDRMADEAVLAMLAEARRWQPGGGQ